MKLAPIVLFVYNRPLHTQRTVEALLKNALAAESDLYIYADAAKSEESVSKVLQVRDYIKNIKGFRSLHIVERDTNLGLAESVILGVTDVVNQYGKVIVVEDDLVTSPYFLTYMNKGLDLYQSDDEVISIHAYTYPIKMKGVKTFFLKGADCWGWATWKRGWSLFDKDGQKLLNQIKRNNLSKAFDFNGSYPYTQMLQKQISGKNDSWAIRWYASAFLHNKYTLYPAKSLIQNIGLDLSGTHSDTTGNYNDDSLSDEQFNQLEKIKVEENQEARKLFEMFFRKNTKIGLKQRIINFISR
ncbi:glycosyl transferase [Pontibacter korlensis]|uniref:Glycosyl transferase n=1 Tax=Pontibacter korlensis TaxID=400092 RepID=A0A0E3UXQ2_9BACT|nr:glycosyl transferase [Pontibacter korlensis]AKD04462.1 glycosyl transferase [Pontibacter korlensis]